MTAQLTPRAQAVIDDSDEYTAPIFRRPEGSGMVETPFGIYPQNAWDAFETHRVAQTKILGMPGLKARPSFMAGWKASMDAQLADALRYRWLRDHCTEIDVPDDGKFGFRDYALVNFSWKRRVWRDGRPVVAVPTLDAAVDAALAATGETS